MGEGAGSRWVDGGTCRGAWAAGHVRAGAMRASIESMGAREIFPMGAARLWALWSSKLWAKCCCAGREQ